MALPLLNWKFVGTKRISISVSQNGTLAQALDAFYQLGAQTTYADGTARVPGTGSAWTWTQDGSGTSCVAVYGVPATTTAVGMKYILAGDTSTTTYPKLTPDTSLTSGNLLVGMNRSSGAYAGPGAWATAAPFTTASSFSGYYRIAAPFPITPTGSNTISLWESQEACVVQLTNLRGVSYTAQFGALFDPLTYTSGVTCETDQRLYYLFASGGGLDTTNGATFLSNTTATVQSWGATPGTTSPRCGYFLPGTNTVSNVYRGGSWTPSATFVNPAGRTAQYPFWAQNTSGQFLGAARNFYIVRDAAMQSAWMSGASTVGYTAGFTYYFGTGDTVLLGT